MIATKKRRWFLAARAVSNVGIVVAIGLFGAVWCNDHVRAGPPGQPHHGHKCQHCGGRCGPHCPVRPGLYGFYGTQWRQWPGQGFMSSQESPAATPVQPPRMAVPGPDEESIQPRTEDSVVPLPESAVPEAPPRPLEREPVPEPAPPAPLPPAPSTSAPSDEDNLFNTNYRPKSMRKLSFGLSSGKAKGEPRGVEAATHLAPADLKSVPRVRFDPAGETRQLRIQIK